MTISDHSPTRRTLTRIPSADGIADKFHHLFWVALPSFDRICACDWCAALCPCCYITRLTWGSKFSSSNSLSFFVQHAVRCQDTGRHLATIRALCYSQIYVQIVLQVLSIQISRHCRPSSRIMVQRWLFTLNRLPIILCNYCWTSV